MTERLVEAKPPSPLGEFLESKLAVAALAVLVVVIAGAVLAPLLAPQDPYDLSAIDIAQGRLPPGSAMLSEPREGRLGARVEALRAGQEATAVLRAQRDSDADLVAVLGLRFEPIAGADRRWRVRLTAREASVLDPLREVAIDGLPRGASLSPGSKARFRNRWTLDGEALAAVELSLVEVPDTLVLRLALRGGEQRHLMTFWLGTDAQGRDMLSAILYGLRISLAVSLSSVAVAVSIGTLLGLYAAYVGGRFDTLLMRLVDLQLSFPTILVALVLLAVLGKGVGNVVLALVIVQWAFYARTARGIALAERRKEYVEAANSLALARLRIMVRHILPNCLPSLIVVATLQIASAITLEATLSFLGLGLPVTQPSLGLLISNGFEYLLSGYPWIGIMPGVALLVTVVCINLVGDELRDVLNPRLR